MKRIMINRSYDEFCISHRALVRLRELGQQEALEDVDDRRLVFSITLEDRVQPEDQAQTIDGVTVAVPAASATRIDSVTVDYQEPGGFKFHHTDPQGEL